MLSYEVKTYFIKSNFVVLLMGVLTGNDTAPAATNLLVDLGKTKLFGVPSNDRDGYDAVDEDSLLHYCIAYRINREGIEIILYKGPDVYQVELND